MIGAPTDARTRSVPPLPLRGALPHAFLRAMPRLLRVLFDLTIVVGCFF